MQQIFSLGQRIQRFEDLLKGQDVLEKLEQLEQKMYQIQDDAKDKFEELNNEVADNSTRISSTENQNIEQGKKKKYLVLLQHTDLDGPIVQKNRSMQLKQKVSKNNCLVFS